MSVTVNFNGSAYTIPAPGEVGWATSLNAFLTALAALKPSTTLTLTGSATASAFVLVPQASAPTGPNVIGSFYVTSAGVLKVCTVAGSPGTFVSVGSQT